MFRIPISGLSLFTAQRLYFSSGAGNTYQLDTAQRLMEIDKLKIQLKNGQITQAEFDNLCKILNNAPMHIKMEPAILQSDVFDPDEHTLKAKYEKGEITTSEYWRQQFMLSNPNDNNEPPSFSAYA